MSVYKDFADRIATAIEDLQKSGKLPGDLDLGRITVEPPRDPTHGDLATNAAMVLGKAAGVAPRDFASLLVGALKDDPDIAGLQVAGPGFVNLTLHTSYWRRQLLRILDAGTDYGRSDIGQATRVNVEYVSANPTGPLHVGHCRGAVFGDALASLLDFTGHEVVREYYINDAGAQVEILARSAFLRYREALGEEIGAIPDGLYPGDYLKPVGEALKARFQDSLLRRPEEEWLPLVRDAAIEAMMETIREDLRALDIKHDVFFSERSLVADGRDRVAEAIQALRDRGQVYEGRLPPPKGQLPEDWEDREQTLFRSTEFGDDVDRPLMKSDGSYTYFAADIAYHYDKYLRGFRDMIDVWGADHGGYVKRMTAAVMAMSGGEAALDVKLCQLVRLFRAGEPVKMSKRAGDFVTLREVVDEVGRDAVRFMMLNRKNDAPLDFDFVKVTEQSKDNPVFYVQYAHARACSVERNTLEEFPNLPTDVASAVERIAHEGEIALIKRLAGFPALVEGAARAHEPHRLTFYLYDLASDLHAFWNLGKDSPQLRFINADDEILTLSRLSLLRGVRAVLAAGLNILGVSAPERM
jgi:arginyl-tRNA synthetase